MRSTTRVLFVLLVTAACGALTKCGVLHAQAPGVPGVFTCRPVVGGCDDDVVRVITLKDLDGSPVLSDLERAKLELLQARIALAQLQAQFDACKAEVGATYNALGALRAQTASQTLTAAEQDLKAFVERNHPGYTWDPKTGIFTKTP